MSTLIQPAVRAWLEELEKELCWPYTPSNIAGGHDFTHVKRMILLGLRIAATGKLDFDMGEFEAAAWLHNLDRTRSLKDRIKARGEEWAKLHLEEYLRLDPDEDDRERLIHSKGVEMTCFDRLRGGPFDGEAQARIVDAVMQHNKKDDDLERDSTLLTAIRIADKLDRFGALGVLASAAFRGSDLLAYDPDQPFDYLSTVEGKLKSLYNDLFRILEWYGMLPYDWAREMVVLKRMDFFVNFIRTLGEEIAEATGKPNWSEGDIKKALGQYYDQVAIETIPH